MTWEFLHDLRILVVDDDEPTAELLLRLLERDGYRQTHVYTDPRRMEEEFARDGADLILLDLHMPHVDGRELLARLRALIPVEEVLPIIVLTADVSRETRRDVLQLGASEFLTKPFDRVEVLLRIRNLLHMRHLYKSWREQHVVLEDRIRDRTRETIQAQMEIIDRLGTAAEMRDDDTGWHTNRVGTLSAAIGQVIGMSQPDISRLRRAAPLHDVGKIGIPDTILLKPGKLTPDEFETMKRHTVIGARILSGSRFPVLKTAEQIALCHHENWDGTGYPSGMKKEEIPLEGRIVAIADVFDALTHYRPYKEAWSEEEALAEIAKLRGKKFDPQVTDAFFEALKIVDGEIAGLRESVPPSI